MESYNFDLLKSIKSHQECALVSELYGHISNFRDDFIGKVKHTLVLSPVASASVGFDIIQQTAILGVQHDLFDIFMHIRWYSINVIKNHGAMFWIADFGERPKNHPVGIRFSMRTSRANSLSEFEKVVIVRLDKNGMFEPPHPLNSFELKIKICSNLEWEKL